MIGAWRSPPSSTFFPLVGWLHRACRPTHAAVAQLGEPGERNAPCTPVQIRSAATRKPGSLVCIDGAVLHCLIFDLPDRPVAGVNRLHTEAPLQRPRSTRQPCGTGLGKLHRRRCSRPMMNVIDTALLVCCSSPHYVILTPLTSGKILTRPEPEIGGSWADLRLPFYTSGFK